MFKARIADIHGGPTREQRVSAGYAAGRVVRIVSAHAIVGLRGFRKASGPDDDVASQIADMRQHTAFDRPHLPIGIPRAPMIEL